MIPKYRAWNTKSGRFAKDGELFLSIDSKNYNLYSVDFDNFRLENDNYILMQSTGLRDKNGVEVYEGDILKTWIGGYEQASPYVVEDMRKLYFELERDDSYYRIQKTEILGNIYENPELLEEEE